MSCSTPLSPSETELIIFEEAVNNSVVSNVLIYLIAASARFLLKKMKLESVFWFPGIHQHKWQLVVIDWSFAYDSTINNVWMLVLLLP